MTTSKSLCVLQFAYASHSFEANFQRLSELIERCPDGALILAPELCLSGYAYETMQQAAAFSEAMFPKLCALSTCKSFGLTLITQENDSFFNTFMLFDQGACLYRQHKVKLFALGDETHYFQAGKSEAIQCFVLGGIKIAVLICFELRFIALWEQIRSADIILVPAFWGKARKMHLETLSSALAIANQCYVLCANSADGTMASSSGIISPFGEAQRDDDASLITLSYDPKKIQSMRRYIDIGLLTHATHGPL